MDAVRVELMEKYWRRTDEMEQEEVVERVRGRKKVEPSGSTMW